MVSDSELVERLREVLRESDLTTTTTGALRRRLEEDFGVDLSDKKTFVREQVDLLLSEFADKAEREDAAAHAEGEDPEQVTPEAEGDGAEGEEEEEEDEEEEEEEEDGDSNGSRKKKRR
jgi:upstream activation factor subunit UAF30